MTKPTKAAAQIAGGIKKMADAVRSARADIKTVEGRSELTRAAKREAVEARRQELREEVHGIQEHAEETLEKLRAAAPSSPDPEPLEAMRIWARLERLLKAGEDPTSVAQQLVTARDRTSLIVLRQELPAYMQANGESQVSAASLQALQKLEAPLMGATEKEYHDGLAEAEKASERLRLNGGFVLRDLETADRLFGVEDGEYIDIKED
jgi:hypothetical protein